MNKLNFSKIMFFTFCLLVLGLLSYSCGSDDELGSVSGTITFENVAMWPDSGEVQVVIFPEGVWTSLGAFGPPQNSNDPLVIAKNGSQDQYDFKVVGLPAGEYSSLAVGWRRPNAQNYPGSQRTATLGVYWSNPNETSMGVNIPGTPLNDPQPSVISLGNGENLTGLDFKADFKWVQINQDSIWTTP